MVHNANEGKTYYVMVYEKLEILDNITIFTNLTATHVYL